MSTSRRRFLRSSALAAAAVSVKPLAAADKPTAPARSAPSDDPRMLYYDQFYFKEKPVFRFEYPFDGGVLQEGTGYPILGTETGADGVKRLRIHVVVRPGDVGNLQVFDPEGTDSPRIRIFDLRTENTQHERKQSDLPRTDSPSRLARRLCRTGHQLGAGHHVKNLGMNYGLLFTAWGFGGFALALLAGRAYDETGNFNFAYYCSAVLLAVAAVTTFIVKPPHRADRAPVE